MGAGKSTLADRLAGHYGWRNASFGRYVREIAAHRGLEASRSVLQDLGAGLIAEQGWPTFCMNTLAQANFHPGESLVVDGIRHVNAVLTLRELVKPSRFYCVGVDASPTAIEERLKLRESETATAELLEHSTEAEVDEVLKLCDLRLSGRRNEQQISDEVIGWVDKVVRARLGV